MSRARYLSETVGTQGCLFTVGSCAIPDDTLCDRSSTLRTDTIAL